jgi:16S rRNA (uracil1498-N3)-methyltransferase
MSLRVFASAPLVPGEELVLEADESHYLSRVRRAAVGDAIELLDGICARTRGEVIAIEGRRCRVRVGEAIALPEPAPLSLVLGLPDVGAAIESIAVACELGATHIALARSTRTPGAAPTTDRIARVVRAAQRQCGRARPPAFAGPLALADALAQVDAQRRFVALPSAPELGPTERTRDRATAPPQGAGTALLVGPEGGLAPGEAADALAAGFDPISLGPWTLRTATAVAAGLALVRAR